MNKIKSFGFIFLMMISVGITAQEKSEIVMTEAELESFLNTVAETRRAQIRAQKEREAQQYLADLRAGYNSNNRSASERTISNYEILREIDRLNARLDLMSGGNTAFAPSTPGSSSTIVVPGGAQGGISYLPGQNTQYVPAQTAAPVTGSDRELETARAIWELENQLDSLKSVQANIAAQEKQDDLGDLKNQVASLEERIANAGNQEERRSLLEELLAKFKNYKKQIFFPNNVSDLSAADYNYIAEVSEVLKKYPELSVVLEGFASPKGAADYNKQLSMKRSESVEQALQEKGISKDRIVSSFRGEDHSTSEAGARRVDMSIILK